MRSPPLVHRPLGRALANDGRVATGARAALAGALLLTLPACVPSPESGGFDSPDPGSLLPAITRAVRTDDRAAIGHLLAALWSDDPAVRLMAEDGLRRLTGTDVGYRHFDPPEVRAEAIRRWNELAVAEGWVEPATTVARAVPLDPSKSDRPESRR